MSRSTARFWALLPYLTLLVHAASNCSKDALPTISLADVKVTSGNATVITDYGGVNGNDICYIVITVTHPGTNDSVDNFYALPLSDWNGRFLGIGGGGFVMTTPSAFPNGTALGYATGGTDGGHSLADEAALDASPWALRSTGNVDQYALLNFAHRSLYDMTVIGKQITAAYYGTPVKHSYWEGCSTGGRQGLSLAQYYPSLYDGIVANAPAAQWNDFIPGELYLYLIQIYENYTVPPCELDAVVAATIDACDALDGLIDGFISAPALCNFSVQALVGQNYTCDTDGSTQTFTEKAATVIDKMWEGARTPENQWLWYGLTRGANFSGLAPNIPGNSTPQPFAITNSWFVNFLAKDPNFSTATITLADFAELFVQGHMQYDSTMGSANHNLAAFKRRGGKLITWQGLADQLIPPQGAMLYYQKVLAVDPSAHDFYRQFYSPGVGHCEGGNGVIPLDPLGQVRAWVENGTAPDTLQAGSAYPINASTSAAVNGSIVRFQDLCPWPAAAKYNDNGDPSLASSYECDETSHWLRFPGPAPQTFNGYVGGPGWYGSVYPSSESA